MITSTRSNTDPDARRDFDAFDPDEELRRMRQAQSLGYWRIAAELAANLDEYLSRGGELPVAWVGPACMQTRADLKERHQATAAKAAAMTPAARETVMDYVDLRPEA